MARRLPIRRPAFLLLLLAVPAALARREATRLQLIRHAHAVRRDEVSWRRATLHRQIPSDVFTEDPQVMDSFPDPNKRSKGAPSCNPKCWWTCTDPTCEDTCEPLCTTPLCQTRCPKINFLPLCKESCEHPECVVVCPQNKCTSGHCPQCKTICGSPKCKVDCQDPPDDCVAVCEQPLCEWKCKRSDSCQSPQCKMECESEIKCGDTNDKTNENLLPPKKDEEFDMGNFTAKMG